jgi:flagellar biosynthesis/type III secretory pathway M-ring protein FliF/YscJ
LKNAFAAGAGLDLSPTTAGGRGDRIELLPMRFDRTAEAQAAKTAQAAASQNFRSELIRNLAAAAVVLIVAVMTMLFYRKARAPRYEPFEAVVMEEAHPRSLPAGSEVAETDIPGIEPQVASARMPGSARVERLRGLAAERPEEVARQLETWITQ